ncbi:hypothetical protein C3378_14805 [Klebsiella michiganensis]|nr:hypothetical protein C3378_14805 [Klebsiella michiganensis]
MLHKNEINFKVYNEAIVLPCKKNYMPKSWGEGGVIDFNRDFIYDSGLYMKWISFGGKYEYDESIVQYENKEVIWFGFFYKHWGHFLLDFLSRMWYLIDNYRGEEIVYISHNNIIDSNYIEFFKLLGVDEAKIRKITIPTRFKKIIIPEFSRTESYYNEHYLNLFKTISERVLAKSEIETKRRFIGKSFYLSRSLFSDASKKELGEKYIEEAFVMSGFQSISPEKMSFSEQILLWNLAERIACVNGTLPLNFLFGSNELSLVVLNKTNLPHKNLDDVLEIKKNKNVKFIDVYDEKFVWASENIGDGPFVLKVTPSLQEYLGLYTYTEKPFLSFIQASYFVFSFKTRIFLIKKAKSLIKKMLLLKPLSFKRK